MRFIFITGIFAYAPRYKNAQSCLTGKRVQKVYRQADFTFDLLATRMARRSDKKKEDAGVARPHPYCPREWWIDRSGGTRDDLNAGSPRACPIRRNLRKRVCDHRIGAHPLLPPPRIAFSFKSSFNQERVFVSREITSLPASEYLEDTVRIWSCVKRSQAAQ